MRWKSSCRIISKTNYLLAYGKIKGRQYFFNLEYNLIQMLYRLVFYVSSLILYIKKKIKLLESKRQWIRLLEGHLLLKFNKSW